MKAASLVTAGMLIACALLGACGASFAGPATSTAGDPCQGHYDCGWACCWSAGLDGEGWSCNPQGSKFGACSYVGLSDNGNGIYGAKGGDAGR